MDNGTLVALWVDADMEIEKRWTRKSVLNQSPGTLTTESQMKFWKEGNGEQADSAGVSLNKRWEEIHARPLFACED